MNIKKILSGFALASFALLCLASCDNGSAKGNDTIPSGTNKENRTKLSDFLTPNEWRFQYPGQELGMLMCSIDDPMPVHSSGKNPNNYLFVDNDDLTFSLSSKDSGRSTNGAGVRAEIASNIKAESTDNIKVSYSFSIDCDNIDKLSATLAQIMIKSQLSTVTGKQDIPIFRLEINDSELFAVARDYDHTLQNKPMNPISLGKYTNKETVDFNLEFDNDEISLTVNGNKYYFYELESPNEIFKYCIDTTLGQTENSVYLYLKFGLYYGSKCDADAKLCVKNLTTSYN